MQPVFIPALRCPCFILLTTAAGYCSYSSAAKLSQLHISPSCWPCCFRRKLCKSWHREGLRVHGCWPRVKLCSDPEALPVSHILIWWSADQLWCMRPCIQSTLSMPNAVHAREHERSRKHSAARDAAQVEGGYSWHNRRSGLVEIFLCTAGSVRGSQDKDFRKLLPMLALITGQNAWATSNACYGQSCLHHKPQDLDDLPHTWPQPSVQATEHASSQH